MITLFRRLALVAPILVVAAGGPSALRGQSDYAVTKVQSFTQEGAGVLVPGEGGAYAFYALSPSVSSITTPGDSAVQMSYLASEGDYADAGLFSTLAELDAAYPAGSYIIAVSGGTTVTLNLPEDEFPPVAQVIGGSWNASGQLEVDPTTSYTFNLIPFPGYASVGVAGEALMTITSSQGVEVASQSWLRVEEPFSGTYSLAAGTLAAGETYNVNLDYYTYPTFDSTTLPGSELAVIFGSFTSFTIIATAPPASPLVVVTQPASETVANGTTAVLNFQVTGSPSPTYQWYFNGLPLQTTSSTLVIIGATQVNAGSYYCVASNGAVSVQSNPATLTVVAAPDRGRLINISCRAQVGTGSNILIAGFAVGGAGTLGSQSLLLRGSGPALASFGVNGTLADPELQVFDASDTALAGDGNTSWGGSAAIATAAATVGAFPWTVLSSHDAAVLTSLSQGAYTAQISGESGDSGVALAEIYDATPAGSYTAATPRVVNISARVQVGTGGNILIAGFVIGGGTSETLLIRASGPALATFGVAGMLPDPQLSLLQSTGIVLATNAGWGGSTQIANAAHSVGAFAWTEGSQDSALLVTLPPGAYTAQVAGLSGDTGVALIEVYEVP